MSGRDPAMARWGAIQLARWLGVALELLGIAVLARRPAALASAPAWLGYLLLAGGLGGVFVVPALLARRWRSQAPNRWRRHRQ